MLHMRARWWGGQDLEGSDGLITGCLDVKPHSYCTRQKDKAIS